MLELLTQALTARRYAAGAYVNGVYVRGAATTFSILCRVCPLTAKEMEVLEEGLRTRAAWLVITETALRTVEPDGQTEADEVVINGETYIVKTAQQWAGPSLQFCKASCVRKDT